VSVHISLLSARTGDLSARTGDEMVEMMDPEKKEKQGRKSFPGGWVLSIYL
jgi:hypothetical protein